MVHVPPELKDGVMEIANDELSHAQFFRDAFERYCKGTASIADGVRLAERMKQHGATTSQVVSELKEQGFNAGDTYTILTIVFPEEYGSKCPMQNRKISSGQTSLFGNESASQKPSNYAIWYFNGVDYYPAAGRFGGIETVYHEAEQAKFHAEAIQSTNPDFTFFVYPVDHNYEIDGPAIATYGKKTATSRPKNIRDAIKQVEKDLLKEYPDGSYPINLVYRKLEEMGYKPPEIMRGINNYYGRPGFME